MIKEIFTEKSKRATKSSGTKVRSRTSLFFAALYIWNVKTAVSFLNLSPAAIISFYPFPKLTQSVAHCNVSRREIHVISKHEKEANISLTLESETLQLRLKGLKVTGNVFESSHLNIFKIFLSFFRGSSLTNSFPPQVFSME